MSDLLRPLADFAVSPVAFGAWPISGMTTPDISDAESLATVAAALDAGINFFDTAYAYGPEGESERLIARALAGRRDEAVLATKCGIEWAPGRQRIIDGRPATLHRQCRESLRRLATDRVELLYLHAPDPHTPVAESAGALRELLEAGLTRSVGVSNFSVAQLEEFAAVCPLAACQPPYNLLMREIEEDVLPWSRERNIAVVVYWPLLKGLLAGKLTRDHVFPPGDGRAKYPMFQGEEFQRNLDFVERLRAVADEAGKTVSQVVVNWTIHQPGITAALCGARKPEQIRETAGAMGWRLTADQLAAIEAAIRGRGKIAVRYAV